MKLALLLSLSILLFPNKPETASKSAKTYYYFGLSRSMHSLDVKGKQYVLFTPVAEIVCEESYTRTLTNKWGEFVDARCQNEFGCTSDLNTYATAEQAKAQYEKVKAKYKDTAKYITTEVVFSGN